MGWCEGLSLSSADRNGGMMRRGGGEVWGRQHVKPLAGGMIRVLVKIEGEKTREGFFSLLLK